MRRAPPQPSEYSSIREVRDFLEEEKRGTSRKEALLKEMAADTRSTAELKESRLGARRGSDPRNANQEFLDRTYENTYRFLEATLEAEIKKKNETRAAE